MSNQEENQNKPYSLGDLRILIIEDSVFIAELLASCLMEMGVGKVFIADGVAKGKDKLLSHNSVYSPKNLDMVVLDWLMPDGNGGDVLRWMRKHKSQYIQFLPVVVCSAYTDTDIVFKSRDAGANEVMVKPVSAQKIASRILHIIDHPRPFVQSPDFVGPDRRRRTATFEGEDKRKTEPEVIKEA